MDAAVLPKRIFSDLADTELARVEVEERQSLDSIDKQIADLKETWRCREARRRLAARERLRRSFAASPFGRLVAESVLPFLAAGDSLRWLQASPAVIAQHCALYGRIVVHHIRNVLECIKPGVADALARRLQWFAVESMTVDLGREGWVAILTALATQSEQELSSLRALSVAFPSERSARSLQRWQVVVPVLSELGSRLVARAPLQELVLHDLRSADFLTSVLSFCGQQLRICRATLIGPGSRTQPLALPATGLPALECLVVRQRDFCEQRVSRQERLAVHAQSLLACLQVIRRPERLKVLVLAGICVDGAKEETAQLLRGLIGFRGLCAVSLRFSVPATFGTLLPLKQLLALRRAWPKVGHFVLSDMSVHGFDYWPEQMTEFREVYPHCRVPDPSEVFINEFRHVLASQYHTAASTHWHAMPSSEQAFWASIARMLPNMPHSEVWRRVVELFPGGLR
mmetsp:Transcript_56306/g.163301  ORF Transcript_56306/g.163301 Transcript_56306/m.163301 type:complete len:458 (-) Transcript_56306:148-1521(-)